MSHREALVICTVRLQLSIRLLDVLACTLERLISIQLKKSFGYTGELECGFIHLIVFSTEVIILIWIIFVLDEGLSKYNEMCLCSNLFLYDIYYAN